MAKKCAECQESFYARQQTYKNGDKIYCYNCAKKLYPDLLKATLDKKRKEKEERTDNQFKGFFILIAVIIVIAGAISLFYWGKGKFVSVANENTSISAIRDTKAKTFIKKGKLVTGNELMTKTTALSEFMKSGATYRMEGDFWYGYYKTGGDIELRTNVKMSYNNENDVYKFIIENEGGDKKLNSFKIDDGTYYIVKENGKTYVLSWIGNEKKATDISRNKSSYNFLMSYCMDKVILSSVFSKEKGDCYHLWDAEYYYRRYDDIGYMVYSNPKTELKVYKDKPVYYLHRIKNNKTDIEYQFILNYYYDKIPEDKPLVSDYQ